VEGEGDEREREEEHERRREVAALHLRRRGRLPARRDPAVEDAARKKSGGGRWVRETREVKASPQRAHERCNQPGRKETEKIGVPRGPGFGCFKVRASQALGLGQCSKQEKLQPESAAGPSGHLHKRALSERRATLSLENIMKYTLNSKH
jgi:hypothetical protein